MPKPIDRITAAAIKVFREQGIENARLEDIAKLAKVSRPNLYRYVNNREDLVRLVILHRAQYLLNELKVQSGPWHEALTELFVKQVTIALRDEIFMQVVEQAGPVAAKLLVGDNAVRTSLNAVISPLLAKGRAAGEIREDLSDDEILYWLHYQTWSLTRDPRLHKVFEIRSVARKFIVGGLLAPAAAKAISEARRRRKVPVSTSLRAGVRP